MNPELKAARERLLRWREDRMALAGFATQEDDDILAVCTALEKAMRVVEAAKEYTSLPDRCDCEIIEAYHAMNEALAAMEEK